MRNRKLFSKVSNKEILISEERIKLFEDLGEERLKEERRSSEMALKDVNDKINKRNTKFKSVKTFGFYTTKRIPAMSLDYSTGALRKTLYKEMVCENNTHTRFWNAQEGSDWIVLNEVHNDDYRSERNPLKLTKLERKRQENQTFISTFPNQTDKKQIEKVRVDIVPE